MFRCVLMRPARAGLIACLAVLAVAWGLPAASQAGIIWKSDFETVNGVPVTHGQEADPDVEPDIGDPPEPDAVDNTAAAGLFGEADFSQDPFAVWPAYLYKKYGVGGVPAVPSTIDPSGATGQTAFYFANEHRAVLNTELPSGNVPGLPYNLNNATTVEGYFNTAYTGVINWQTTIPVRLYGDMRDRTEGAIRLAVGISNYQPPTPEGLRDYEGFNYTGANIAGQGSGIGWKTGGTWAAVDQSRLASTTLILPDGAAGLNYTGLNFAAPLAPLTATASMMSYGPGTNSGAAERQMSAGFDMGAEGKVLWISCLMRRTGYTASGSRAIYLQFFDNVYNDRLLIAVGSSERLSLRVGTGDGAAQINSLTSKVIQHGRTYFFVACVKAHASGADEGALWVFDADATANLSGNTIPATEAELFAIPPVHLGATGARSDGWVANGATNAILDRMWIRADKNNSKGEIDEIRIGSTYQSVVDANAPISAVPPQVNALGMYYVTAAGSGIPVYGSTPIVGNTWYHFAAVYDGSDPDPANRTLKAYLNGNPEITITNPNLIAAGSGPILIGNDRFLMEANVRNWYGLVDEVRVYDAALTPAQMMVSGPPHTDHLIWASSFETEKGQPVAHDQEPASGVVVEPGDTRRGFVSAIDNSATITNSLGGYVATPSTIKYLKYGQSGIPPIPAALDPAGLAGETAYYTSMSRAAVIQSHIPSDSGNLPNAITFECFFNSWDPTQSPGGGTTTHRRLFSQKWAANSARLGLGLEVTATGNALGVYYRSSKAHHAHGEASDTQDHTLVDTTDIVPHQWYKVKLIYNGTTVKAYLNDQLRISFQPQEIQPATADPISIANHYADGSVDRAFYGLIDHVVIRDDAIECSTPFADIDGDKDVDQEDFGRFQACYTGTDGGVRAGCECFNRPVGGGEPDNDVDGADLADFLECFTGPAIEWSQAAYPDCGH